MVVSDILYILNHHMQMKLKTLIGYVLKGNDGMFALMSALGFARHEDDTLDGAFVTFSLDL